MENFNHYRFSFENLFFKYLKGQITLESMIDYLYDYEKTAREEYAEKHDKFDMEHIDELNQMGFAFRWFDGDSLITTIRNLEGDLSAGNKNRERTLELMESAISLDTTYELQIFFA